MPGDLEQSRAEEEHHPGIVGRAELPVDGQAQYVAVEAVAAVQVAGPQECPAAQNVHATSSTAGEVKRQVNENAQSRSDGGGPRSARRAAADHDVRGAPGLSGGPRPPCWCRQLVAERSRHQRWLSA